jgi:GST-like protein
MSSPNVRKVVIALEEMGLSYRTHHVSVFRARNFEPEFLALNPFGKVPVLVDAGGPAGGCPIFESGAILLYLADTYGDAFLPSCGPGRWEVIKWLFAQVANIGPIFGQHSHFRRRGDVEPYAAHRFRQTAAELYRILDRRLQQQPYLAGEAYSIADMATYPWATYLNRHGLDADECPALSAWTATIAARPAVEKSAQNMRPMGRQDLADRRAATSEETDRFLWRHFSSPTAARAAKHDH